MSGYVKELCVSSSSENGYTMWEALPKVFLIHNTEDDAEPAMCTIVTPPVK